MASPPEPPAATLGVAESPARPSDGSPAQPNRRHKLFVGLGLLLFFALFGLLLLMASDPHSVVRRALEGLLARVRDPKLGIFYVLLAYGLGTIVFAPITLMFGATTFALSPLRGFLYAMLGGLFGASVSYGIGRLLGAGVLRKYGGQRLNKLSRHVQTKSFRSVLIARFLPVGNFTLINLFLGSMRVPFGAYVLANVVGILPSILALTLLSEQVHEAIHRPSVWSIGRLVLAALALLAVAYTFSRFMRRRVGMDDTEASGGSAALEREEP